MIRLATKRTYKNKRYNKPHLANKLDKMATNIAKRGVYIVAKANPGYNIVNYITKEVVKYLSLSYEISITSFN